MGNVTVAQARKWLIKEDVKTKAELEDYSDDEILDMYYSLV